MKYKKFLPAIFLTLLIFVCLPTLSFAADSLTFEGNLTLQAKGSEISVNGTENISMPKPFTIETQDDYPTVLAMTLKDNGHISEKAAIIVKTSESFILKSSRILGVFVIRGKGDKAKLLRIMRSDKNSYELPALTEDYYIQIEDTADESNEDDDEIIEAATLFYVKMSVAGSAKSDSKYPMFGQCTGDGVRLRDAPETDSKIIGKLDKYDNMTIFDKKTIKGEAWYLVEDERDNITAWINGRYVKIE